VVKPISPYLLRPLRTLEQAQRDLETQRQEGSSGGAPTQQMPAPPLPGIPGKSSNPKDIVTIGGQDVVIEAGAPAAQAAPGSQLDVKA
jgi:hypothetical protein